MVPLGSKGDKDRQKRPLWTMARTSHRRSREKTGGRCFTFGAILIVLAGTALTLQFIPTTQYEDLLTEMETLKASAAQLAVSTQAAPQSAVEAGAVQQVSAISMQTSGAIVAPFDPRKTPLLIPPGKAQNLPSIRVEDETIEKKRGRTTKYGGSGDKKHLGGFTEFDGAGVSPKVWKWMIRTAGVKSFLDVGCGRGTSTTWFLTHGVDVLCAEGSHDAVTKTFLPDPATQVVEHDFSRGPWWPEKTYDAVWAVEFLEHVNVQYHFNYITAFRKAALIFVTSSRWGGWHHVEVHNDEWWIRKYELYGFQYDQRLTDHVRKLARDESRMMNETAPDGNTYNAQHIWLSMKVRCLNGSYI